jgi:hypothetical protein
MTNFSKKVRLTGVFYYEKVNATSLTNVTVATMDAGQTVDGVLLTAGMKVALCGQTTGAEDGVYTINADGTPPTRAKNWEAGTSVVGYAVRATAGTANKNRVMAVYAEPAVVGTHDLNFIEHERI